MNKTRRKKINHYHFWNDIQNIENPIYSWNKYSVEEVDYFLITFFGVFARSASDFFFFFGNLSISFIISVDGRISAFNNFDICSKQASFS